jgi:hypothetical protein
MVESHALEMKVVMPANAGIQVHFRFKLKNCLESGFRRNDGESRHPVAKVRTLRFLAEGRSTTYRFLRGDFSGGAIFGDVDSHQLQLPEMELISPAT